MLKFFSKSIQKVFGSKFDRDVKVYLPTIDQINDHFASYASLSNDQLRNKTHEFKRRIEDHLQGVNQDIDTLKSQADQERDYAVKEQLFNQVDELANERDKHLEAILLDLLPEAFAVVKETSRRFMENDTLVVSATDFDRNFATKSDYVDIEGDQAIWKNRWTAAGGDITWNMVHYDVQLIGGMVLHSGKIAEMATGEGKTLVATLPAYLNGLSGSGVHVITVNDYLARRDSEWIGPIMEFLFLTISCIDKYKPHSPERLAAYQADIVYGTNNEFGFDYLRDNMVRSKSEQVQGKHHFAMLDEVDSVLIDDARTPLIISGPVPQGEEEQEYIALKPKVERLIAAQRKIATENLALGKQLFNQGDTSTGEGGAGMAILRAYHALPKYRPLIKFLSEEGVKVLMQKTENLYMQEQSKRMHIVDDALYFVIDEKNKSVDLTEKGAEFLAQGNDDPHFFVMPDMATGINDITSDESLTEEEKANKKAKLIHEYAIKSKRLHSISQLLKAYTLFERDDEYVVIDGQVKIVDEQTGRMMEGRRYSDGLHQALEAKEGVKVGDLTQTYATVTLQNYFRMYHKLAGMTGTAETEAGELWEIYKLDVVVIPTNRPIVRDDREDLVYKTAREKFNAVIDQIQELRDAGRPILVGTTSVEISEKLSRMLNLRNIEHNVLNAKQHQREADIVTQAGKAGTVTIATNMAGRGTDIKLGEGVKEAKGLAIIGTERHDSRRVDRQLRGRAGRQGDPGASQFYVSLEDNLMRLFQSEKIAKLMDKMGHQDGEVIQHSMVSKSIERAQKKLEENNFGIRKRLLEYDDVMNIQREAIYTKRANALTGQRLSLDLNTMFMSLSESLVLDYKNQGTYEEFRRECMRVLGLDPKIDTAEFNEAPAQDLVPILQEQLIETYDRKADQLRDALMPFIKEVYNNPNNKYQRISIPYGDGTQRAMSISADLEEAVNTDGASIMRDIEKAVSLALIDESWKEHLRSMDELKESVQSASFEQKDPLVIYKMEAYGLFEELVYKINEEVTSFLLNGELLIKKKDQIQEAREQKTDLTKVRTNKSHQAARAAAQQASRHRKVETFVRQVAKVGRNEPCPCGSGKKYKQCHGNKR